MRESKLILKKEWVYYVYQLGDDYELSVPVPDPAPGFDVVHLLNEAEKRSFLANGISALQSRMDDMNANKDKYECTPWT